nr:ferredoxin [Fulvivirga lutimaris]
MAQAAEKLIAVLLDDEELTLDEVSPTKPIVEPKVAVAQQEEQAPIDKKETPPATVASISEKAWVESEECTTCNECIDKYPNLFKYNGEQQAYIEDPAKGTFEELVKAAEKCPAACIHPGMPLNTSEPNLDKLVKRAEKFN